MPYPGHIAYHRRHITSIPFYTINLFCMICVCKCIGVQYKTHTHTKHTHICGMDYSSTSTLTYTMYDPKKYQKSRPDWRGIKLSAVNLKYSPKSLIIIIQIFRKRTNCTVISHLFLEIPHTEFYLHKWLCILLHKIGIPLIHKQIKRSTEKFAKNFNEFNLLISNILFPLVSI